MTRDTQSPAELSLFGGPMHRLGLRLGLVRGKTNTALIGLMLGPALWLVIAALALMEGSKTVCSTCRWSRCMRASW